MSPQEIFQGGSVAVPLRDADEDVVLCVRHRLVGRRLAVAVAETETETVTVTETDIVAVAVAASHAVETPPAPTVETS